MRRRREYRPDRIEIEAAVACKSDDGAVDAEIGEDADRPLKLPELLGSGDAEAVALANHHAEGKRDFRLERAHEIERRGQPVALDLAHQFQPVGSAAVCGSRIGERLDDDLEEQRQLVRGKAS